VGDHRKEDVMDKEAMLELFRYLGNKASYHYADDTGHEWSHANTIKKYALRIFDACPDMHDKMRDIAKGFLWSLKSERPEE
jgi:hypothetical protein